ncbi:MAG: hypothetical protein HON98_03470 [Chloroflexi bacterium]|nr:hypothetical protein [Chloroflexota bacterium]
MKNSANTYGSIPRFLHWVNALLIILVWFSSNIDDDSILFYWGHMMLGIATLVFTLAQIIWFFVDKKLDPLPDLPKWRKIAIHWNHILIMLIAFLVAASGIFLWQTDQFEDFHELLSIGLVLLFLMHVAGTFLYQFTKGKTLARMGIKFLDKK